MLSYIQKKCMVIKKSSEKNSEIPKPIPLFIKKNCTILLRNDSLLVISQIKISRLGCINDRKIRLQSLLMIPFIWNYCRFTA